jgi:hypothetical protein
MWCNPALSGNEVTVESTIAVPPPAAYNCTIAFPSMYRII